MNLLAYLALICFACIAVPLIVGFAIDDGYDDDNE